MQYIDLRSDTVTHPTTSMREKLLQISHNGINLNAMQNLLKQCVQITGKQAATFVPTGCFGNQCSILTAGKPFSQILLSQKAHIISYQNGNVGLFSRMLTRTLKCDQNMFIQVQNLKKYINQKKDQSVFAIQNPTSCGRIYPKQTFQQLIRIAKNRKLHVHMDGARLFNGCSALNIQPKQLVKNCDSVMFCLSKGLSAPIGSIVVGSKEFIQKFNKNKQLIGGKFQNQNILAQLGLISLRQVRNNDIKNDNLFAKKLAQKLNLLPFIELTQKVDTNMIFFKFTKQQINQNQLKQYLMKNYKINSGLAYNNGGIQRFVCHRYIRDNQIQKIIEGMKNYYQLVKNK